MKYFNKKAVLAILAAGFLVCQIGGNHSKAQNFESSIVEGESFDNIRIGRSTADDVTLTYGAEDKLINHNEYSFEMIYKNLGLSFYYCQSDPNKEIFVVEIEPPARASTSKGIVLGESTFADVLRLYGEIGEIRDGTLEYEGIYFYDEEELEDADDKTTVKKSAETDQTQAESKIVKRIELVEKDDLRQCDDYPKK